MFTPKIVGAAGKKQSTSFCLYGLASGFKNDVTIFNSFGVLRRNTELLSSGGNGHYKRHYTQHNLKLHLGASPKIEKKEAAVPCLLA